MCRVNMDLTIEDNLQFAIYSLIMEKTEEFSEQELISELKSYQQIEDNYLTKEVHLMLKTWVDSGMVREYLDTYALAV